MTPEIENICSRLKGLCVTKDFELTLRLLDAFSNFGKQADLLVAAAPETEASLFADWIKESIGRLEVNLDPLATLSEQSPDGILAEKIVILIEGGKLIGLDTVELIAGLIHTRPADSYAIVLSRVAGICDAEELDLVERGAWRLLVPEPKGRWNGQSLPDYRVFLWDVAPDQKFLTERIQKDSLELANWLRAPVENRTKLISWQLLRILDTAEKAGNSSLAQPSSPSSRDRKRLEQMTEQLDQVGQRVVRRLSVDRDFYARYLAASIQDLDRRLAKGLRKYLEQHLGLFETWNETQVVSVLREYLNHNVTSWFERLQKESESQKKTMIQETAALFGGLDWEVINRWVPADPEGRVYPEQMIHRANIRWADIVKSLDERFKGLPETPDVGVVPRRLMLVNVGLLAVVGYLIGGPAGGLVSGTVGLVVSDRVNRSSRIETAQKAGLKWLASLTEDAYEHATASTKSFTIKFEEVFLEELSSLKSKISDALAEINSLETEDAVRRTSQEIQSLRQLVVEMSLSD
jgi:hypothetical protein